MRSHETSKSINGRELGFRGKRPHSARAGGGFPQRGSHAARRSRSDPLRLESRSRMRVGCSTSRISSSSYGSSFRILRRDLALFRPYRPDCHPLDENRRRRARSEGDSPSKRGTSKRMARRELGIFRLNGPIRALRGVFHIRSRTTRPDGASCVENLQRTLISASRRALPFPCG